MRAWLPVPLYLSVVLAISTTAGPPTLYGLNDKTAHVIQYAGLAFLVGRAVHLQIRGTSWWVPTVCAFLFGTGAGAIDEWVQSYASLRNSDFADVAADSVGSLVGGALATIYFAVRRRASSTREEEQPDPAKEV